MESLLQINGVVNSASFPAVRSEVADAETEPSGKTGPLSGISSWGPSWELHSLTDTMAVQMERGGNRGAMTQQILEPGRTASRLFTEKKATGLGLNPKGGWS